MQTQDTTSAFSPAAHPARRRAFTLIEMLAAIAIICLLIGVAVSAFAAARTAAWKNKARATARQLAAAWNLRLQADGRFPDHTLFDPADPDPSAGSYAGYDWKFSTTAANMSILNSNANNVVYFEQNGTEQSANGQVNGLRDHWGNYYHVILDFNYDGQILNPIDNSPIQANVVVWSTGPGPTKDVVIAW